MKTKPLYFNFRCSLGVILYLFGNFCMPNMALAQCSNTTISAPLPQMGAMIAPQFVNLWKHAGANDKHGEWFKNDDALSIGDDGWPIAGKKHGIRFYPDDVIPRMKPIDTLIIKYKGPASAFSSMNPDQWACKYQNIKSAGQYTTLELVTKPSWLNDGNNGFWFQFDGRIEDIQIVRPGYKIDDPRYLTDEYVKHIKSAGWVATRYMGLLAAPSNFGETWPKRVSPNAPMSINQWQWSAPDCNNLQPQYPKFSENQLPFPVAFDENGKVTRSDGMWSRGAPWEMVIDISNYLDLDMWINIPTMADDDYVRNLAGLIKKRLKPSLNVNVEIGNELWNFGAPFMGFYMLRQKLGDEWREQNPEKLKILGGKYCPGCNLSSSDTDNPSIDRGKCENDDYQAYQRWQARRLKEHAESFATVYGWRDEGGEVGTKIRMVLAGQFYGGNGMGWNIGPGIEFLQKAYGDKAPGKYLYAVSLAPYIGPHADPNKETKEEFLNMSIEDIERRTNANADSYFQEYNELWTTNPRPIYFGNLMEGVYGKARMFGLKFFAYEGGNELNTGGVNWGDGQEPKWENQKNADAYLSSPRAAALSKRFFDRWFSWFGYDALFMKNGDYQSTPMGGYSMSHTLNEDIPMRNEYVRIANSPAIPLSKERGNLLNGEPLQYLDARKTAAYNSDWENNAYGFPTIGYGTSVNPDYSFKSSNSMERPFIIRCQKAGKYQFSIERSLVDGKIVSDKAWPTYCDIYINEKLVAKEVNLTVDAISRNIKYDVDGGDRVFGFTTDIILDIPYGVHVLRVHPSAPTAARPGNDGYYGGNNIFNNKFDLAQYRFKYDSPTVPKMPKGINGEGTTVCKSNAKALYEVQELDMGACEYVWSGLPTGAKILPLELVAGSNPARFLSGQGTFKIYIDWGTVPVGTYNLQVLAKNEVGESEPLKFTVKVQTCGFEINPTPVCKNEQTTFTPEPMAGVSKFLWDNGIDGAADRYKTLLTPDQFKYTYTNPGTYYPTLTTQDADGKTIEVYRNTVNVTSCNEPIVASPIRYCKGATAQPLTAILNTSSRPATALKWYSAQSGGSEIPTPTPSTALKGTTTYYVSQVYSPTSESDRAAIVVNVADAPDKPTVVGENPFVLCQTYSSTIEDIAKKVLWEAGATPRWYTTATGGESTINPTIPAVGATNVSIFISAEKLTCESERLELKISKVSKGPEFIVETKNPENCGENGEIQFVLYGSPNQNFKVSYNGLPEVDKMSTDKSRIILSLPAGTYKNFKVSQDGCESVMNAPRTIENRDNSAIGGVTRADTNLLAVNGKTIVRIRDQRGDIKWQVSKDGAPYKEIPGAIKDTVGTGNLSMGVYSYKVLLTNGSCNIPVSSTISVIKVGQPIQPVAGTISTTTPNLCYGGTANLSAQGYTGTVQWQDSTEGSNFADISGASMPNYTSATLSKNVWYRTKITTTLGSVYSSKVMITVSSSLLNNPTATNFTVISRQPTACGALGAIILKGLSLNTAFKVNYNFNGSLVEVNPTSVGDSIRIPLIKGTYADFKVSINTCSKTVLGSYILKDPASVPLVESGSNSNYCQFQVIEKSDLINRVIAAPTGVLKWYSTVNGVPTLEPDVPSTAVAGTKKIWVRQIINNCDSDTLGLKVVIAASSIGGVTSADTNLLPVNGSTIVRISDQKGDIKWQVSKDGGPYQEIPGATKDTVGTGNLSMGVYSYKVLLTNSSCLVPVSSTISVIKVGQPVQPIAGTISTTTANLCFGGIATLSAQGYVGNTIQWQDSTEGSTFADISGATLANYTSTTLSKNVWYRTKITTTLGSVYSNKVMITVSPSLLSNAAATNFTVIARQPAACGDLGAIVLKELSLNTAYKVNYNFNGSLVDITPTSVGDSIRIPLIKGTYADFKVSINTCSKTVLGNYILKDPVSVPLVEKAGNSNYCQNQVIAKSDLIDRVKAAPTGVLKWYTTVNGVPTLEPEAPSTAVVGEKKIWVRQTINNCDSDTLGLKVVIAASSILKATKFSPSSCGLADGKIEITGLIANNDYQIEYKKAGLSAPLATLKSDAMGIIAIGNLGEGIYTSITATPISGNNCLTNSKDTLQLIPPLAPTLPPTIVGGNEYCAGSTIAPLTATANSGGKIDWFKDPALTTPVAEDQNTYNTGQVSGKVTYYAVERVGICKSPPAQTIINIIAKPEVQTVIGTNGTATCNVTGYSLSLKDSELGVIYTVYKDNIITSILQNGTGDAITFPDQSEEGIYTIKGETEVKNCKEDMSGSLKIDPKKYPAIFVTSGNLEGCEGIVANTAKINLSNSEEFVLYTLMNSNMSSTKLGTGATVDFVIEAKSVNNGLYTITAKNTQTGCESAMSGEALINIKSGVGTPTLFGDNLYCNDRKNEILITVENATEKVWSISPQTVGTIDNFGVVTWDSDYTGPATIKVMVSNNACGTETKTAEFATTVMSTPEVSTILGDSLVCKGNIVTYQILPQIGITYKWNINFNTILEEDDSKGTLKVTYLEDLAKEGAILSVTPNSLRCGAGDTQTKTINKDNGCDLFVPNILTPNTADKNSVWQLEGVENYPKLSIQIFNRWGAEVHSHNGKYDKPWDGTMDGKSLPTATYYYVIDKKDGTGKITGSVTVVRE